MTDCIFCNIITGNTDTSFVYQDDKIVVFNDINPQATVHLLLVTREHIKSLREINEQHINLIAHITMLLPKLAQEQGLEAGFRTVINTGRGGGQVVDHLHYHLLGGALPAF